MSEAECQDCAFYDIVDRCKIGIRVDRAYFFPSDILFGGILSVAPFFATPCRIIRQMLSLAELKSGEVLYDLGSGDGRILILAAGEFGAKAIGYELEGELVEKSLYTVCELNFEDRVKIVHDDLFNADLGIADVITMYLTPRGNQKIKPKLERELRSETRVVSLMFEIPGWKPDIVSKIVDNRLTYTIYVYKK